MDMPKPTKEHEWLQRLVGRWTFEADMAMGPGEPRAKATGVWDFRPIGGFWVVAEGEGASHDGSETNRSIMTIGFDPAIGRYVGTFICSPMSKLWIYEGALEGDDRLVLSATGPAFDGEGEALYRDVYETAPGGFRLISYVQGPGGEWTEFMTADYRPAA